MTKYNIVTGWRRGGTSAIMSALRQAGIPVIGYKFPITLKNKMNKKIKLEDVGTFRVLRNTDRDNPTGFWEMSSVCLRQGLQKDWNNVGIGGELMKICFEILTISDPKMIDKVIIILRKPSTIIKSRIKAPNVAESKSKISIRLVALSMLHNAILSLRWLKINKIPYQIIFYEELIKTPQKVLKQICKFLKRGDCKWGAKAIQSKLNTSKSIKYKCEEIKMVEEFYNDIRTKHAHKYYDLDALRKQMSKIDKKGILKAIKGNKALCNTRSKGEQGRLKPKV